MIARKRARLFCSFAIKLSLSIGKIERMGISMKTKSAVLLLLVAGMSVGPVHGQFTDRQLGNWLKRFPDADANGDGRLTIKEAQAYRQKMQSPKTKGDSRGAPRQFAVDPGWQADRFPDHAVCYKSPKRLLRSMRRSEPRQPKPDHVLPKTGGRLAANRRHRSQLHGAGLPRRFPSIAKPPDSSSRLCSRTPEAASPGAPVTNGNRKTGSFSSTANPHPNCWRRSPTPSGMR